LPCSDSPTTGESGEAGLCLTLVNLQADFFIPLCELLVFKNCFSVFVTMMLIRSVFQKLKFLVKIRQS
jgi:hypothetical protein